MEKEQLTKAELGLLCQILERNISDNDVFLNCYWDKSMYDWKITKINLALKLNRIKEKM